MCSSLQRKTVLFVILIKVSCDFLWIRINPEMDISFLMRKSVVL